MNSEVNSDTSRCRKLPDPGICRTRLFSIDSRFRHCLVAAPVECPYALRFGRGYLCRRDKGLFTSAPLEPARQQPVVAAEVPTGALGVPRVYAGRILVVDDEPAICGRLRAMLELDVHDVVEAHSAEEALELFQRRRFDLVITDYEMPTTKGDQLARAIKRLIPDQPVALLTGHVEKFERGEIAAPPVDLILRKPWVLQELRQALADLLKASF